MDVASFAFFPYDSVVFDPDELRQFARRDWDAAARISRVTRAKLPVDMKVRLAIELYEAARRQNPGWPDDKTRAEDHAMHRRLRSMLDAAPHVGEQHVGEQQVGEPGEP